MPFSVHPHRRFPVCCPMTYHAGLFEGHGIVWNLSVNGSLLSGDLPVQPGETLSLTVTLSNEQRIEVPGAVVERTRICGGEYRDGTAHPRSTATLCEAVGPGTSGDSSVSDDRPISPRFNIALVLAIVCLTSFGCADIEPAVDTSKNNRAAYEATAKALRKSAEEGDASAQYRLGQQYDEGTGVPRDYGQAKEWFEKAAKQGHAGAQVNLGTLYLQGEGAPQSDQMALFWFRPAAEQGHALAFAKLGWMSAQGRGVLQDFIQAHKWYNLAAANGHGKAAEYRDALAKQMTPAQIAEAQKLAQEWKPKGP